MQLLEYWRVLRNIIEHHETIGLFDLATHKSFLLVLCFSSSSAESLMDCEWVDVKEGIFRARGNPDASFEIFNFMDAQVADWTVA